MRESRKKGKMMRLFCFVSRAGQIISKEVHAADAAEGDDL